MISGHAYEDDGLGMCRHRITYKRESRFGWISMTVTCGFPSLMHKDKGEGCFCTTAEDLGAYEYGGMIAHVHPDCPEHGEKP